MPDRKVRVCIVLSSEFKCPTDDLSLPLQPHVLTYVTIISLHLQTVVTRIFEVSFVVIKKQFNRAETTTFIAHWEA